MSHSTVDAKIRSFILCSVLLFTIAKPAFSDVLILSPDNKKAHIIANKIKSRLQNKNVVISDNPDAVKNAELVITLGSESHKTNINNIESPTLASFVSPSEYSQPDKSHTVLSEPIYSVISPKSLMEFLDESFGSVRVGYIYSGKKSEYITEMEQISEYSKAKIVTVALVKNNVFKTIRRMLSQRTIDVMVISNDTNIYNRKNIRFVLEALYREKIPTIGLSNKMVDAGAVATVFSEEDALVEQTIAAANTYLITGTFTKGMYASLTSVEYKKSFVDEFKIRLIGDYVLK